MNSDLAMISIIVCSANAEKTAHLINNIKTTISCPHEFIIVNNSVLKWGICKAYNWGGKRAKGEYLCFVHEDISFETKEWGGKLVNFARSITNCGVIGFAGGAYVAKSHISWFVDCKRENYTFPSENNFDLEKRKTGYEQKDFSPVITLDGLFLFMKRNVWQEIMFDEKVFDGFHFYDMDISTAIWLKGYQNFVCYSIDLVHYSRGKYCEKYLEYSSLFRQKYRIALPLTLSGIAIRKQVIMELRQAFAFWCYAKRCFYTRKKIFKELNKIYNNYSIPVFLLLEILWIRHRIR